MGFVDLVREDRRLAILDFLSRAPGGQMNMSVTQTALKSLGHRITRSELTEEAAWLEERGLLVRDYDGPVPLLTITERGGDAAEGVLRVDGVKRQAFRG